MNPVPSPEDEAPRAKRALPPELEFMRHPPMISGRDGDEGLVLLREHVRRLRGVRESLRAIGLDADKVIADQEAALKNVEQAHREADGAVQTHLHAIADTAEAEVKAFQAVYSLVSNALKDKPFDPQLQEWMEQLEEWKQHMPKE